MNYSENLKTYRFKLGLTQKQMAKKLHLKGFQAYQHYERNLTLKKAHIFSQILKYDLIEVPKKQVSVIEVLLKYAAKFKAKEEGISEGEALKRIIQEVELSDIIKTGLERS